MRAHLLAQYAYLFGGVLFGFVVQEATRLAVSPTVAFVALLISVVFIAIGWLANRPAAQLMQDELNEEAVERIEGTHTEKNDQI